MTADARVGASPRSPSPTVGSKVLVVGPGWLGSAIASAWAARGASVWTLSRRAPRSETEERTAALNGVQALLGDITEATTDAGLESLACDAPTGIEHVVLCVAPSRERGDRHEVLYPSAARGAVRLAVALRARSLLYTSSTGVYGASDGSVVCEDTVIVAREARQRTLLEAEEAILTAQAEVGLRRIVLRVAGLYGPGRDPARRFLAREENTGAPDRWTNFAWRDDVVKAVVHLLTHANGMAHPALFNCADGHPVLTGDISRALERSAVVPTSGGAIPSGPRGSGPPAPHAAAAVRSNQRVSVDRLLATGWTPDVRTVYEGLVRLGHAVEPS